MFYVNHHNSALPSMSYWTIGSLLLLLIQSFQSYLLVLDYRTASLSLLLSVMHLVLPAL